MDGKKEKEEVAIIVAKCCLICKYRSKEFFTFIGGLYCEKLKRPVNTFNLCDRYESY